MDCQKLGRPPLSPIGPIGLILSTQGTRATPKTVPNPRRAPLDDCERLR
jgi:hypothetical protein